MPMNQKPLAEMACAVTRRAFVKSFAFTGAVCALLPIAFDGVLAAGGDSAAQTRPAVVSFYMDRLYLDLTGTAAPYLSPLGMRSGAPLAHLSEEAFRRAQLYV